MYTGQLCCGAPEVVDVPLSIASQGLLHRVGTDAGGISPLIQKLRLLWQISALQRAKMFQNTVKKIQISVLQRTIGR